jgi:hypothetical protein
MKVYLNKFKGLVGNNSYITGENLVWVDFALAEFFQCLMLIEPTLLENYENLTAYQKRVWALPELQNYFKSERWTERPCNNTIAKWK